MSATATVTYALTGQVDFHNLLAIREQGEAAIREAGPAAVIDLSGLDNGNSAAVALLMAWFRLAESLGTSIVFLSPPEELVNIVELSGMRDLLPFSAVDSDRGDAADAADGADGAIAAGAGAGPGTDGEATGK